MINWIEYLIEVSICHSILYLVFYALLRNVGLYKINRFVLLGILMAGFVIPLVSIPFWDNGGTFVFNLEQSLSNSSPETDPNSSTDTSASFWNFRLLVALVYVFGSVFLLIELLSSLFSVRQQIVSNEVVEAEGLKKVFVNSKSVAFSFFHFLFLSKRYGDLDSFEQELVIRHEKCHIKQVHSLDNFLVEIAIVCCWFNPILRSLRSSLKASHEYHADRYAVAKSDDIDTYNQLILQLAISEENSLNLTNKFSENTLKKRIIMLSKKSPSRTSLFKYLSLLPIIAILLVTFSFGEKERNFTESVGSDLTIASIYWSGNTLYEDDYLSDILGVEVGGEYDENLVNSRLSYLPNGRDITSLHMDRGYLFFSVDFIPTVTNDMVNLEFEIYEGDIFTFGDIVIVDSSEDESALINKLPIKKNEVFNRSLLIKSQKVVNDELSSDGGIFVPYPIPDPSTKTVAVEFRMEEN